MLGAVTITEQSIDSLIKQKAYKYGVDPSLVKAIIKNESNFNPMAYRHEPHINDTSWGLMQVLLKTAREVSGNSSLTATELIKPEINIDVGTKYIAKQLSRYNQSVKDAIAAYNAGSARKTALGAYVNQSYVTKVYNSYLLYKGTAMLGGETFVKVMPLLAVGIVGYAYLTSK